MSNDRYEKGIKKIQEFTVSHDAKNPTGEMEIGEAFKDIAPDLSKYVVEFAFGDIYSRPGLDNKQKVLTTISSLVSQGMPQIEIHINSGLNVGLTPEEIVGCIVHLLPYTGFPRVLNALKVAQKIFDERGINIQKSNN
ncbi:MAG: carboxymuconolactone decarboxylase family protein [Tissierella sp.]|uniref:carboxymuconolactone decarboxylase family protein n=1 Tax=Tissierella sp. TaxID=41274 RepID=UPI003F982E2E